MAPWNRIAGRRRAGSPQVGHTGVQHPLRDSEPDEEGAVLGENQEGGTEEGRVQEGNGRDGENG